MSLTSASTLADVVAQYKDNLDYDLDDSTAKCRLFIQAARFYLLLMTEETRSGGTSVRDNYQKIQAELEKAEAWLASNDTTVAANTANAGEVRHLDFSGFRN